jgi:hypothetical protein
MVSFAVKPSPFGTVKLREEEDDLPGKEKEKDFVFIFCFLIFIRARLRDYYGLGVLDLSS